MSIQNYQKRFIELAIKQKVLCFGEFTLKSGRASPYFFNAGRFYTGASLSALGQSYARTLIDHDLHFDLLFGPAYKGIPLVTIAAASLFEHYKRDYPVCYNRKEVKDHGEGGLLVGAPLEGRVVIVDDVITAGTAIREVMQMIARARAKAAAVIVGLDRQERGEGRFSAIQEIEQAYGIPVISIINLDNIIAYLSANPLLDFPLEAMLRYRENYGIQ